MQAVWEQLAISNWQLAKAKAVHHGGTEKNRGFNRKGRRGREGRIGLTGGLLLGLGVLAEGERSRVIARDLKPIIAEVISRIHLIHMEDR